jgi:class 3 adenylate cyclase
MGSGDLHDAVYDDTGKYIALHGFLSNSTKELGGHCVYSCTMYVTSEYEDEATSSLPAIATTILALTFFVVIMIFILYDCFVERRNSILLETAEKSHNILSSLFPQNVRERLFADQKESELAAKQIGGKMLNLKSFVDGGMDADAGEADDEMGYKGRPIADLFTESTVLFADIAGFTAWSSQREPAQVFTLLETLYRAFDEIAKKRRVFKVETIGDCYVAVTGVPEPQKDHAVIMCRFARDMMNSCRSLTKKLETTLGPDTGELDMRIGLHSGPVTAGVLRGERSRFQLFGDTMNTASRTGNTGQKGKIQLSQETTDLLIGAGKAHWVTQRKEKVYAKGKGEMQTYWLSFVASGGSSGPSHAASSEQDVNETRNDREGTFEPKSDKQEAHMALEKTQRLVAWNSDVLLRLLKQIVARRKASDLPLRGTAKLDESKYVQAGISVIDEVREIITLPTFDRSVRQDEQNLELIKLDENVVEQVYDYVSNIAALYRNNPFHNFEHASHVTMSVTKLLSRIVAPSNIDDIEGSGKSLHDHTYGITNDPLTQFACVFSALIHDVDHPGVPNSQLIDEKTPIAQYYKNKSVAEQNSVDLAWKLLGDESYDALRSKIYTNEAEMKRFRELVVNSVMATDIVDKELKTLRNKRWEKAFSQTEEVGMTKDSIDRKATIVIEHLIQASDVAHTMQHWHIYRKWNERFFFECYKAYIDGRAAKDPSESWYVGEMGFFDFYIIPLAKKLKDCGVFGVSSDEYLNYAQRNRKEWEDRGRDVVHEMVEKAIQEFGRSCKEEPQAFL